MARAVVAGLAAPLGHAAWALARAAAEGDDGSSVRIALAAAALEVAIFACVALAVLLAVRTAGRDVRARALLPPLAVAQWPAVLYFAGLLPPLTQFAPLLPLVLALRSVTTTRVALRDARLPPAIAVVAVLGGAGVGIALGFAIAGIVWS